MAVYEYKAPSDHIQFAAFTHGAYAKGDYVSVGALTGIADISCECGGRPRYRSAASGISGRGGRCRGHARGGREPVFQ